VLCKRYYTFNIALVFLNLHAMLLFIVKSGVGVSQVKPSNCITRLEKKFYIPFLT